MKKFSLRISRNTLILFGLTAFVFIVVFFDIFFLGKTLRGEPYAQGVLPSGPVYYNREPGEFQGHLSDPGASSWNNDPPFVIALNQLKKGYLPWWNPYNGTGTPLVAALQSGIMFPPKLAILFFNPSPFMFDIYAIFRILVAFVFTYLFLRLLKINKPISLASAFAFAFSGSLIRYINLEHMNIDAFIPFYMFSAEYFLQKQTFRRWLLVTLALLFLILGGFPEASLFAFILVSTYFLFRWFTSGRKWEILKQWVLANVSVLFLSAPILVPFVIHMGETWTIHEPGSHVGTIFLTTGVLFSLVTPVFFNNANMYSRLGLAPGLLIPGWVGGVVLITGLMSILNNKKNLAIGAFFGVFGLLAILKDFGFPLINWIGYLPIISQAIVFKYNNPALTFALVVASAFFLQSLLNKKPTWWQLGIAIATFVVFYLLFILQFHHAFADFTVSSTLFSVVSEVPKYVIFLVFITGVGFLIVSLLVLSRYLERPFLRKALVTSLLATIILETFLALPKYHPRRDEGYPPVPFLTDLKKMASDDYRISGRDYVLFPDFSGPYQILDPRILDAMYLKNYYQFVKVTDPDFYDRFINLSNKTLQNPAVLRAMGVKYVLATNSLEEAADLTDLNKDYQVPKGSYTIGGETRSILSIHPPFDQHFKVTFPQNSSQAYFYLAMNPLVWDPTKGDGVCLNLTYASELQRVCTDPKNNPSDRVWKKITISKPANTDQIDLEVNVDQLSSYTYDWAGMTDIISGDEVATISNNFAVTPDFPIKQDNVEIYSYTLKDAQKIAYYPKNISFVEAKKVLETVQDGLSTIDNNVITEGSNKNVTQKDVKDVDVSMKPNGDLTLDLGASHPRYLYVSQAYHKNLSVNNEKGEKLNWYKANIGFILVDAQNASKVIIENDPSNTIKLGLVLLFGVGLAVILFVWRTRKS